jgi:hypothetical protein
MTTSGMPSFQPLNPDGTPASPQQQPPAPQPPRPTPPPARNWSSVAPTSPAATPASPAPTGQPTQFMQVPPAPSFMQRPVSPAPMHTPAQVVPAAHGAQAQPQDAQTRASTKGADITLLALAVILPCVCVLTLYGSPFAMLVVMCASAFRIKQLKDQNQKAPYVTWTALWWAAVMIPLTLAGAIFMEDWSLDQIPQ